MKLFLQISGLLFFRMVLTVAMFFSVKKVDTHNVPQTVEFGRYFPVTGLFRVLDEQRFALPTLSCKESRQVSVLSEFLRSLIVAVTADPKQQISLHLKAGDFLLRIMGRMSAD